MNAPAALLAAQRPNFQHRYTQLQTRVLDMLDLNSSNLSEPTAHDGADTNGTSLAAPRIHPDFDISVVDLFAGWLTSPYEL